MPGCKCQGIIDFTKAAGSAHTRGHPPGWTLGDGSFNLIQARDPSPRPPDPRPRPPDPCFAERDCHTVPLRVPPPLLAPQLPPHSALRHARATRAPAPPPRGPAQPSTARAGHLVLALLANALAYDLLLCARRGARALRGRIRRREGVLKEEELRRGIKASRLPAWRRARATPQHSLRPAADYAARIYRGRPPGAAGDRGTVLCSSHAP